MRKKLVRFFCFQFSPPSPLLPNPQKKTQHLKKKVCHVQKKFSDLAGTYHIQIAIVSVSPFHPKHPTIPRNLRKQNRNLRETCAKLRMASNQQSKPPKAKLQGYLRKQNRNLRETCAKLRMASNQQSKPPKAKLQG